MNFTVYLPYVAGLGEDLKRVCRKFGIRTVFKNMNTLRQQLTKVKDIDPSWKRSNVVYKIVVVACLILERQKEALRPG